MTPDPAQLTLDGDTDVVIRRHFQHAPTKVWRVLTDPALIRQWLSPDLTDARMDARMDTRMDTRPGGSFRYDWPAFFFCGPVPAAAPPHRMVHVEHFNGDTSEGPTVTTNLIAAGTGTGTGNSTGTGTGTLMTVVMRYRDAKARATATQQGFTDGITETYGRIAELVVPD